MENQNMNSPKVCLISLDERDKLLETMDFIFPNYVENESKNKGKCQIAYELMLSKKWKVHQFQEVLKEFGIRHKLNYWMPAHLFEIHRELYGDYIND